MSPRSAALWLVAACIGLAGCTEPSVGVRLKFPSEPAFLWTETITLDVYDGSGVGDASPAAICAALSVTAAVPPEGQHPIASSTKRNACDFREGGVQLRGVDVGRVVLFALAQNAQGESLLSGCATADVYGDAQSLADPTERAAADALGVNGFVDVTLAVLPAFPAAAPACASASSKCEEGEACTP